MCFQLRYAGKKNPMRTIRCKLGHTMTLQPYNLFKSTFLHNYSQARYIYEGVHCVRFQLKCVHFFTMFKDRTILLKECFSFGIIRKISNALVIWYSVLPIDREGKEKSDGTGKNCHQSLNELRQTVSSSIQIQL